MSYIDSLFDRAHDRIHVVERRNGTRVYREYPANFVFYYDDPRGKHRSIYDTPVSRFSTKNNKEFRKEVSMHSSKQLYESDINPIFRCLEDNYKGQDAPDLHTAFFDIEVDFNKDRGFNDTIKAIAEELEIKPSVLKKAIKLAHKAEFGKAKQDHELLETILETVGKTL